MSRLWGALAGDIEKPDDDVLVSSRDGTSPLTVDDLAIRFLGWVLAQRGDKAHAERSRHIGRFRDAYGTLPATAVEGRHIEAFTDDLRDDGHALDYVQKHLVSVGAMFRKGVRKGWIPDVKPFAAVEPIRLNPKVLTEASLPTTAEIEALFESADADAHGQMGDLLRLYFHTGARTSELIRAHVGDFQRATKRIVLTNHKRSHTMKDPVARAIGLNAAAFEIVRKHCDGRPSDAPIFPRPSDGKPYPSYGIDERFQTVRRRAGVRDGITIYSFRHLWISEALMAGVDVMLVAKMAGTSVRMIETVYGHWRTQSFTDAQAKLDDFRRR
jgi:integrase